MAKTEARGIDATGFWACHSDKNKVFYHKEPVRASEFVTRDIWNDSGKQQLDLLLGHCRYTSKGVGQEKINKNNHPHVSKDFRIALVHNGYISEYPYLKKQYPVSTDCDSEVLLRIFESGEDYREQEDFLKNNLKKANSNLSTLYRVYGLKQIFSEVNYGAMAVAIGERLDDGRALWLFHNEHRPLCLIDLTQTMGQFFFCSTQELFRAAVDEANIPKHLIPMDQGVIKLPQDWVYYFHLKDSGEIEWEKFKVNRTRKYGYWEDPQEEEVELPKSERLVRTAVEVVTQLDDDEDVILPAKPTRVNKGALCEMGTLTVTHEFHMPTRTCYDDEDETEKVAPSADGVVQLCCKGIDLLRAISTTVHNSVQEGNMKEEEVDELVDRLHDIVTDIENTKHTIR